jgi:hypothetical protein
MSFPSSTLRARSNVRLTVIALVACVACGDRQGNDGDGLQVDSSNALHIADPALMAACDSIDAWIRSATTASVQRTDGKYTGSTRGATRYGCQIAAADTLQPEAGVRPFDTVRDALMRAGWSEELVYSADGPEGSMLGLRDDSRVCVLQHYWEAGSDDERAAVPHMPMPYDLRVECFREAPRTGTQ